MPIAHYIPFDPATDVLLRYGQIRQDFERKRDDFLSRSPLPWLKLADLFKPPVLKSMQVRALAWAASPLPILRQQAQDPLLNQCLAELYCGTWLRTLEAITGASNLLPDPYVTEGGFLQGATCPALAQLHRLWRLPLALVLDVLLCDPQQQGAQYRFDDSAAGAAPALRAGSALVWQPVNGNDFPQRTAGPGTLTLRVAYWQGAVMEAVR